MGKNKKYELIDCGTFYQIVAARDFVNGLGKTIRKGTKGGVVYREDCLSQDGGCWIENGATVIGDAIVTGNAYVGEGCIVSNHAIVKDNAVLTDGVNASGVCKIQGDTRITGNVFIAGDIILGDSECKRKAANTFPKVDIMFSFGAIKIRRYTPPTERPNQCLTCWVVAKKDEEVNDQMYAVVGMERTRTKSLR